MKQDYGTLHRHSWLQSELDDFLHINLPAHESLPREIREVLWQIHRSLFDVELNVSYLKTRCRISDNNISSRFRHATGFTIKEYIEALRMRAVSKLLHKSDIGILDVAVSVGYDNLQTFYRVFARYYGCTPGEYRRRRSPHIDRPSQ